MRIKRKKEARRKEKNPKKKVKKGKTAWNFFLIFSQNLPRPQERLIWVSSTWEPKVGFLELVHLWVMGHISRLETLHTIYPIEPLP